jgi:hypothetical protein
MATIIDTLTAPSTLEVVEVAAFSPQVDDLADGFARAHSSAIWIRRTARYSNWRYAGHPLQRYFLLELRSRSKVVAAVVIRPFRGDRLEDAELIDIWWRADQDDSPAKYLASVSNWLVPFGMKRLVHWSPTYTSLDQVLREGAVLREERPVIARALGTKQPSHRVERPWIVMMGDADTN